MYALEETIVPKGASVMIPTGLACAIPEGWEGQIRCRSSLGKKGMILPNGVGTIDSDYRGELKVLATWIGEGIHLLWAKANVLHKCCSPQFHWYISKKLISVPWSQQNEALVDSVHLDNTEERTCNPLMYASLASWNTPMHST